MADALICDFCGRTYPSSKTDTQTGHWFAKVADFRGKRVKLVYAAFLTHEGEELGTRSRTAQDICESCVEEFMMGPTQTESADERDS